ncbi:3 TM domain-containing transmembrane protein [Acrasis kona]|uniref:3 TM domain-containing transmembrane protein n=1 Tax=Acrasis kona TaxID=1008807 RepID=A0AAW2YL69_9EUKA
MVSILASTTILLIIIRVFVAIVIEPAFIFGWPLLLSECPQQCVGKQYPDLCVSNCNLRTKIGLDMKEYFEIDPVTARLDLPVQIAGFELLFITSPLMVITAIGLLAGASWAKKLGLVVSGSFIQLMAPAVYTWWHMSPNPAKVYLFNSADLALAVLLLIWSWTAKTTTTATVTTKATKVKK